MTYPDPLLDGDDEYTTQTGPTPAEKAAAEGIRMYLVIEGETDADVPAEEFAGMAHAAVEAAEPHHQVAAYEEADEALRHLANLRSGPYMADYIAGINAARLLIADQANAIRAELDEGGK